MWQQKIQTKQFRDRNDSDGFPYNYINYIMAWRIAEHPYYHDQFDRSTYGDHELAYVKPRLPLLDHKLSFKRGPYSFCTARFKSVWLKLRYCKQHNIQNMILI